MNRLIYTPIEKEVCKVATQARGYPRATARRAGCHARFDDANSRDAAAGSRTGTKYSAG